MVAVAALLVLGGCGQQDENEPTGRFPVQIVSATFPPKQSLARKAVLRVEIRNAGSKEIPNIGLTVENTKGRSQTPTFSYLIPESEKGAQLANPRRPVWILDRGPRGGDDAYVNTWTLGRLAPHHTTAFTFHVTPIRAGRYTLHYRVSGGFTRKVRTPLPNGDPAEGYLKVNISNVPRGAIRQP